MDLSKFKEILSHARLVEMKQVIFDSILESPNSIDNKSRYRILTYHMILERELILASDGKTLEAGISALIN